MSTEVLTRLEATIAARKAAGDASASHTAALLAKGPRASAQKFGEEVVEAVIAAAAGDREELVKESADTLYHMLVMLTSLDVPFSSVMAELQRREGVSGIAEKAARKG